MAVILYNQTTNTADFPAIRLLGVDVILGAGIVNRGTDINANASTVTAWLDAARSAGLRVVLPLTKYIQESIASTGSVDTASITTAAVNFGSHPAMWGWYTSEEAAAIGSVQGWTYSKANRQSVYTLVKGLTPTLKVMECESAYSSFRTATAAQYSKSGTHDLFVEDFYPFGTSSERSTTPATALSILNTVLSGSMTALGSTSGDALSFTLQAVGTPSSSGISWPNTGYLDDMIAAMSSQGWLTSGHAVVFGWGGYGDCTGMANLTGATTPTYPAFSSALTAAVSAYHDPSLAVPELVASAVNDHVSLSWSDFVSGEDGWYVERRVAS